LSFVDQTLELDRVGDKPRRVHRQILSRSSQQIVPQRPTEVVQSLPKCPAGFVIAQLRPEQTEQQVAANRPAD
jgi:hypothetical protein